MITNERIKTIGKVASEVTTRSPLYLDTICSPDFSLALQAGIERTLLGIDEFVKGRYRVHRVDKQFIIEAMKKAEGIKSDPIADLQKELREQALILGVPKSLVTGSINKAIDYGIQMIAGGFTSLDDMLKSRQKSYPSDFGIVGPRQGDSYSSARKGNPHLIKTGLRRNVTE